MRTSTEYETYSKLCDNIKDLTDKMVKGFEQLQKAIEAKTGITELTVTKEVTTEDKSELNMDQYYVHYDGKTLVSSKREDGALILTNSEDEDDIYSIDSFCLKEFQQVKLNRILNEKGWFMTDNVSCNGVQVINLEDSPMWKKVYDSTEGVHYVPNTEYRLAIMIDAITDALYHRQCPSDLFDEINTIMHKYDPDGDLPDEVLEGRL